MDRALNYSETIGMQKFEAEYFLEIHLKLKHFKKNCKVLDVGCRDGSVTNMVKKFLGSFEFVVGLDVSERLVKEARRRNSDERVDFRVANVGIVRDLKELFGIFDYVFSFFCLHWVRDQRQLWKNMYSILKPGGQVFASFLSDSAVYHVYEIQATNPKWIPYMRNLKKYLSPYLHVKDPEKVLRDHLEHAGFVVHACDVVDQVFVYADDELFRKSTNSINPFTVNMPDDLIAEYLKDFHKLYVNLDYVKSNSKKNQESMTVPHQVLRVIATKPPKSN